MRYQNFIMRVLCLILILGAVIGYNSMEKRDRIFPDRRTDSQGRGSGKAAKEMLTALEEAAKAQEEAKAAREVSMAKRTQRKKKYRRKRNS
ncbi:MAG: hypothetical protein ACLT0W_05815 [Clostridium sp.]